MIFFFSSLVLLLYDTVLANGCSLMYESEQLINFDTSSEEYKDIKDGVGKCMFFIDAPRNNYVTLNFTNFQGFKSVSKGNGASASMDSTDTSTCMPKLTILEVLASGAERNMETLCGAPHLANQPEVFQLSSHIVKLIYLWDTSDTHHSGFTAQIQFLKWPSGGCKYSCGDGSCLPESTLVCNGIEDCIDGTDELHCTTINSPQADGHSLVEKVIIVIVVVITLAVVLCVVLNYRLSTRIWGERHRQLSSSTDGTTLHSHSPRSTEVVYVPGAPMDSHLLSAEREAALQRERAMRNHSSIRDAELNLPPSIAISEDGEEGYAASQRLLQTEHHSEVEVEAIRPPPNRTVFQGESPPPYRSHPIGPRHPRKSDCDCQGSSGTSRMHHANNNNHANNLNHLGSLHSYGAMAPSATGRHLRLAQGHHQRAANGNLHHDIVTGSAPTTPGHSRSRETAAHVSDNNCHSSQNAGASYGPPPDYSEVALPTAPQEQSGLFSNNKSMSNSNV